MKNQTAVEYLIDALLPVIAIRLSEIYIKELTEQALAMEKKQIELAYDDGYQRIISTTPEQYYNQTYKL